MSALDYLADSLAALEAEGRRRWRPEDRPAVPDGVLSLCSNDYLGYATHRLITPVDFGHAHAAIDSNGPHGGAGASRLIAGDHPEHRALEREVASWLGCDDALVFSSGYAANVGLVSALAGPGDVIISDALNHASMIDGCRLSKAHVIVVPHADVEAMGHAMTCPASRQARHRFVLTEGYFSMDGDTPDLAKIRALCTENDAVMIVDDAHALGVIGPEGRGACAEVGVKPDAIVGTFGKAVGGQGAFVAGSRSLTDWLWNRARSFVFSTGISPWVAALDLAGVRRARSDHEGRARLEVLCSTLRAALGEMGFEVPRGRGPIVPVMIGAEAAAMETSRRLLEAGVLVAPIRPPTVPVGTSRLRVTLHARLTDQDLARAVDAFRRVAVSNPKKF